MSESSDDPLLPAPGRPVRLVPTPPGFWRLVLGIGTAALAPLFGFLVGSITGSQEAAVEMNPQYWGLFGGFVLGGLGLGMAMLGVRRLWSHYRGRAAQEEMT
ncbi:hypothetical protein M3148_12425 [Georgenia satyanarayanai]|uniref:hypothetical protein n=1 Tax=Georgenia satyanarayanai TaxID=860221 RepID=UPI00203F45C5|nr:hypothetical protein [Georgenia satyanarayanai]MCM3661786.1 hypothetical protein [Georgenia satyanarayanai]